MMDKSEAVKCIIFKINSEQYHQYLIYCLQVAGRNREKIFKLIYINQSFISYIFVCFV